MSKIKELIEEFNLTNEQLKDKDVQKAVLQVAYRKQTNDWYQYWNGNTFVEINKNDGTKIRTNFNDEAFDAKFPENIDIKITNYCNIGCAYCHENSTDKGKHADIFEGDELNSNMKLLFNSLHKGTELAIGGGMVTSHPDLIKLLTYLKEREIFANITVNSIELLRNKDMIQNLIDQELVKGVGISVTSYINDEVIQFALKNNNAVLHTIAGIMNYENYAQLSKISNEFKVLILGYKDFRRGHDFKSSHSKIIDDNLKSLNSNINELKSLFKVLSFDNLALNQIDIKSTLTEDEWNRFYQGKDATHTMYIDLVTMTYAGSSTVPEEERLNLNDCKEENFIEVIFNNIKNTDKQIL